MTRIDVDFSISWVIRLCAGGREVQCGESAIGQGHRGKANKTRKVAMYLVKCLCNLTLQETATYFEMGSYGVLGWASFAGEITH